MYAIRSYYELGAKAYAAAAFAGEHGVEVWVVLLAAFAEGHIPQAVHLPPAGHPDEAEELARLLV